MIMKRRPDTLQKLRKKKLNWIKMATGQFPLKFNIASSVIDAQIGMFREDQEQLRIIGMKTMFSMFVTLWKYGTRAKKSISPSILIHQGINVMKHLVAGPKHKPSGNEPKSHYDKKQHRVTLKLILSRKKTKQNKTGEGGSTTTNFWKPPTSVIWASVQNTK